MSSEKPKTIKQQKNEEIERLKKELKELEPIVGPCVITISKEESDEEEDDKKKKIYPLKFKSLQNQEQRNRLNNLKR